MPKEGEVTADGFIHKVNTLRKQNKDNWVFTIEKVDGKMVEYKAYNTWIQILRIDGISHASPMGLNVGGFNRHLSKALKGF